MATHSSVLAWRIPGTEEPSGLPSMGSHRVGQDWNDLAAVAAADLVYIQDSCLTRILSANHCSPLWRQAQSLSPFYRWVHLDSKEIKPVSPKGNQPWTVIGRTDAEAEALILWPPDVKSWLTGKDPDAGKDWGQEEKGRQGMRWFWMASPTQWTWIWANSGRWWRTQEPLSCCSPCGRREWDMTEQLNSNTKAQGGCHTWLQGIWLPVSGKSGIGTWVWLTPDAPPPAPRPPPPRSSPMGADIRPEAEPLLIPPPGWNWVPRRWTNAGCQQLLWPLINREN